MPKNMLLYCATDKEIYDLLMSSKQRITEAILLSLGRERGIFYSPKDSREAMVTSLSLLPHGYSDLQMILGHRETLGRAEKITSVNIKGAITLEEIKAICGEYRDHPPPDEKVTTHQEGTDNYVVKVGYSEIDYSKTRLLQRRMREADIEFLVRDDETTIRMPANSKAKEIVAALKDSLDARKKTELPTEAIELTDLPRADARTEFFTSLISGLVGFRLENVTSIRVDSSLLDAGEEDEGELEDQDESDADLGNQDVQKAGRQMLSIVENVALRGQSLLASPEYQQLKTKGFYTTYIIWRSKQTEHPYSVFEFEAGFEEPKAGKAFKYNVRGVQRYVNGQYTTSLRPVTKEEKATMLTLLERTAHGGDNNTKYHITLDFTAELRDKNDVVVPMTDCRKMYMVFAPRFEQTEGELWDGCFLTAGVDPSDTVWQVDDSSALTGDRYFIGSATAEERVRLISVDSATQITVERGYQSSTAGA